MKTQAYIAPAYRPTAQPLKAQRSGVLHWLSSDQRATAVLSEARKASPQFEKKWAQLLSLMHHSPNPYGMESSYSHGVGAWFAMGHLPAEDHAQLKALGVRVPGNYDQYDSLERSVWKGFENNKWGYDLYKRNARSVVKAKLLPLLRIQKNLFPKSLTLGEKIRLSWGGALWRAIVSPGRA